MRKRLMGGVLLLCLSFPLFGTEGSPTLEELFTKGQELSSDYILATYTYANNLLEVGRQEISGAFSWTVTTGDITYYWNDGDDPLLNPLSNDIRTRRLTGSPGVIMQIPTSGTGITVTTPFMIDLNEGKNSTVTPGIQLTQELIGPTQHRNRVMDLQIQQSVLSAESSLTAALANLENSILTALGNLYSAEIDYEKALSNLDKAEINLQRVTEVLGYTEESTTYQEALMGSLQAEQAADLALFELNQAEDSLELLTGYRNVELLAESIPTPTPQLDELRATTSLMSTELAVAMAASSLSMAESDMSFTLDGSLGAHTTIADGESLNTTLSTGLQANVGDGLSLGLSASTNLDKKDFTGGLNFTYTPQANMNGAISEEVARGNYLRSLEQQGLVRNLYTSRQGQIKNQIALWNSSYNLAMRRYQVAKDQYEQEVKLSEEGYSSEMSLKDKELALKEAENSVIQALIQGLQLERSVELFYNS